MSKFDRANAENDDNRQETPRSSHAAHRRHREGATARRAAIGERISVETVVNVMLRKGLCTEAELLDEERRREGDGHDDSHYVRIDSAADKAENWDRPQHPLRKIFAKYRWSRQLGSVLFGWKWKKLKKEHSAERMH